MCGINSATENAVVVTRQDGKPAGVLSWDGFHPVRQPKRQMSEDDVIARALWLAKHGRPEEAEDLLESYCAA